MLVGSAMRAQPAGCNQNEERTHLNRSCQVSTHAPLPKMCDSWPQLPHTNQLMFSTMPARGGRDGGAQICGHQPKSFQSWMRPALQHHLWKLQLATSGKATSYTTLHRPASAKSCIHPPRMGTSTLRNMVQPRRASSSAMSCSECVRLEGKRFEHASSTKWQATGKAWHGRFRICMCKQATETGAAPPAAPPAPCLRRAHDDCPRQAQPLADAQLRVACTAGVSKASAGLGLGKNTRQGPASLQVAMCCQSRHPLRARMPLMGRTRLCRAACQ